MRISVSLSLFPLSYSIYFIRSCRASHTSKLFGSAPGDHGSFSRAIWHRRCQVVESRKAEDVSVPSTWAQPRETDRQARQTDRQRQPRDRETETDRDGRPAETENTDRDIYCYCISHRILQHRNNKHWNRLRRGDAHEQTCTHSKCT